MYRKQGQTSIPRETFELPFEGKLSEDNRWVMMANLIPWAEFKTVNSYQLSVTRCVTRFQMGI
jgi:hypothetical protein